MARALNFIILIWIVFLINLITPFDLNELGMKPRTFNGLTGILTMPLLHGHLAHIISNSLGLFFLLSILNSSHTEEEATGAIVGIIVISGILLWLFGRSTVLGIEPDGNILLVPVNHIGSSVLVYGLVSYLTVIAILKKKAGLLTACIVILIFNGGTYISGMLPQSGISWDGHIAGAASGFLFARLKHS